MTLNSFGLYRLGSENLETDAGDDSRMEEAARLTSGLRGVVRLSEPFSAAG
jgi:hypothetical protein